MGFDKECILRIESVPRMYFCIYCQALVYPDDALQAPCKHLICTSCLIGTQSCPDDLPLVTYNNCKPLLESNKQLAEMIGKVVVCCRDHKSGCQWQGILSDYATHGASCTFGDSHIIGSSSTQHTHIEEQGPAQNDNVLPPIRQQDREPIGQGSSASESVIDTTKEMARKYANAYYLWTWHEKVIEGQTVLPCAKDHDEGMSLFYSTTSALEANLRVKGYHVNELSPNELCVQYSHIKREWCFNEMSDRPTKGHSNIEKYWSSRSKPLWHFYHGKIVFPSLINVLQRRRIVDYKVFDTKTTEGLSDALDHLRIHGPLVGVYYVTKYQKMNADSFGILHGVEEAPLIVCGETDDGFSLDTSENTISIDGSLKNTICITGFGVEDSCSFLQFQKFRRVQDEKGMFARVLASSIVELVGFFVEEPPKRC